MTEPACSELGIEHELQHGTHVTRAEERPASTAVVGMVGAILNEDAVDLPPLHNVIDTDALNSFVRPNRTGDGSPRARIEFRYEGCEVTVYEDGEIAVYEQPEAHSPSP